MQRETIHYTQFSAQLIPPPTSLLFSVPSGYPSDSRGFNIYIWPNVKAAKQSVGMGYQMSTRRPSFPSLCTRATDPTVGMLSGGVPGCAGYTTSLMDTGTLRCSFVQFVNWANGFFEFMLHYFFNLPIDVRKVSNSSSSISIFRGWLFLFDWTTYIGKNRHEIGML